VNDEIILGKDHIRVQIKPIGVVLHTNDRRSNQQAYQNQLNT
jgi:hypothetical protein